MAGSRFYLVREHFTNPAGVHTGSGITLRFGSDGVFVVASAHNAKNRRYTAPTRDPYQANAKNRRYTAATIAQDCLTSTPSSARSNNRRWIPIPHIMAEKKWIRT